MTNEELQFVLRMASYRCPQHGIVSQMNVYEYHVTCGFCGQQMRKIN